jgi:hypothetical protein
MRCFGGKVCSAVQNWTKAKPDRPDDLEDKNGNGNQVEVLKSAITRGRKRSHGGGDNDDRNDDDVATATATAAAGGFAGTGAQGGSVGAVATDVDLQALLSESGGAVDMDAVLSVLNEEDRRRRHRCAVNSDTGFKTAGVHIDGAECRHHYAKAKGLLDR